MKFVDDDDDDDILKGSHRDLHILRLSANGMDHTCLSQSVTTSLKALRIHKQLAATYRVNKHCPVMLTK